MKRLPLPLWWHIHVEYRLQHYRSNETSAWPRLVRWVGVALYLTRRWCQGARRVESGPTSGTLSIDTDDLSLEIEFSGMCPVQGEGWILRGGHSIHRPVYYRSRGEGWSFSVAGPSGDPLAADAWEHSERGYFWPEGGWVSAAVSEACIRRAVAKWREASR